MRLRGTGAENYIVAGLGWVSSANSQLLACGVGSPRRIVSLAQSCSLPALNGLSEPWSLALLTGAWSWGRGAHARRDRAMKHSSI